MLFSRHAGRIALIAIAVFAFAHVAHAGPNWSVLSFAVSPENAPKAVAASDKLMSSAVGKEFPGQLILQSHVADGADPATHSFIPIYKSMSDREAYIEKLLADPAWKEFQATFAKISQPVSQSMFRTLRSWGEVSDDDGVWSSHPFAVEDAESFVKALDKLMGSDAGKRFPGQAHLSAVIAAGISPVTHMVSVGYTSLVEYETWVESLEGDSDWSDYLKASRKAGDILGSNLAANMKVWGPASLSELTGK